MLAEFFRLAFETARCYTYARNQAAKVRLMREAEKESRAYAEFASKQRERDTSRSPNPSRQVEESETRTTYP